MSQEANTGSEPASTPPAADVNASEVRNTPRISEAKLESAHAELPPLSVIGATAEPTAKPGTIAPPKQFGRRGTPRGVAPTAPGQVNRPTMGVVENPAEVQESISGDLAKKPAAAREPRREPSAPVSHAAPAGAPHAGPAPERGPRREPRHDGQRPPRGPRPEQGRSHEQPRREERPRLQIDPVVIPVQQPIGFWASLKRKLATLFGIPEKAEFVPTQRAQSGHRHPRSDRGPRAHGGEGRPRREFQRSPREGGRDGQRPFRGPRRDRQGPRGN